MNKSAFSIKNYLEKPATAEERLLDELLGSWLNGYRNHNALKVIKLFSDKATVRPIGIRKTVNKDEYTKLLLKYIKQIHRISLEDVYFMMSGDGAFIYFILNATTAFSLVSEQRYFKCLKQDTRWQFTEFF
ncbi:MAG TPA: hypothetical protein VJK04_03840 [Candidatus Paceibacterota bacterium]